MVIFEKHTPLFCSLGWHLWSGASRSPKTQTLIWRNLVLGIWRMNHETTQEPQTGHNALLKRTIKEPLCLNISDFRNEAFVDGSLGHRDFNMKSKSRSLDVNRPVWTPSTHVRSAQCTSCRGTSWAQHGFDCGLILRLSQTGYFRLVLYGANSGGHTDKAEQTVQKPSFWKSDQMHTMKQVEKHHRCTYQKITETWGRTHPSNHPENPDNHRATC